MNHEELITKMIQEKFENTWSWAVLRAVVELHKPCRIDKDMTYCEGCSNSAFFPWKYCPTIQAIQEQLK